MTVNVLVPPDYHEDLDNSSIGQLNSYPRKGVIQVGSDADMAIVDMKVKRKLGHDYPVYSKMGYTPFDGMEVQGMPVCTIVRGQAVMKEGEILVDSGYGKFICPTK